MSKSRSFSIFLLKETFDATNSLKEDHSLEDGTEGSQLPEGAVLFVLDSQEIPPWWRQYFGIQKRLMQSLKGAIVFLPLEGRTFALTFGHVHHNLKSECYEYDFGLRVTLNSVDPDELKSVDSLNPEHARRQRTQMSVGSDLTLFDFDRDSTILKSLTGKVKNDLKEFFKNATGASNIRISSDASPNEIPELCGKLLKLYNEDTYKVSFPSIQNVSPVKDPIILNALNAKLTQAIQDKSENVVLTIPDIVNYSDQMSGMFEGEGKSLIFDDIFIDCYYSYLEHKNFDLLKLDIAALKKHHLILTNEAGEPRGDRPNIFKCLIFDTMLDGEPKSYHLSEGNWYLVDEDYVTELSTYLDPLCTDSSLLTYNHADEGAYNIACAEMFPKMLCMDKGNIAPAGQKQVEPCDVFEVTRDMLVLHHVKKSTVSANLSHLFNQGLNSMQLIRDSGDALENIKALTVHKAADGQEAEFLKAFEANRFKVVFQIITHKDKAAKSLNLPLFSRISLKRAMKELRRMGVEREFCFVENQAEASKGRKKEILKKSENGQDSMAA